MRVLLVSTYELGRQPLGLARAAGWLRRAGVEVDCADTSRAPLDEQAVRRADLVAFHLPMHTATRLAGPLLARVRRLRPDATLVAYGLYAPLNAGWLRAQGVQHVFGPEAEHDLAAVAAGLAPGMPRPGSDGSPERIRTVPVGLPDRTPLPPLDRYATLQMPDGARRLVGTTDATRGCKHLCRHCPIVPVYGGRFRAVPLDLVMADIAAQVAAGARHITFGDPDFFNGPTHARRLVERLAREHPGVSYDVTVKIEHLLKHAALLPVLKDTGCLFITSAVESFDDRVLERLKKGHTRRDVERAVGLCRAAGVDLVPTFVAFTPWTTPESYVDLLCEIERLDLVEDVAPVQLTLRLLVTARSALLDLPEVRALVEPFDSAALVWPWRHADPRVDALQQQVAGMVANAGRLPRAALFDQISAAAHVAAALPAREPVARRARQVPMLSEHWYCCAEPGSAQFDIL